VKNKADIEA